jgi:flavin-dependent dehydrogenase
MFSHGAYDALVVGARCAGAATAMLMARRGLRVLAIDRGRYGTDTISTHALMRGGVLQLHRWGILPRLQEAGTPPVRETTFHYGDEAITVTVKRSNGVDALYAPRRTLLDRALVDVAREAGATVWHDHTLVGLIHRSDGRVCGGTIRNANGNVIRVEADLVVGADGVSSNVARLAGAETVHQAENTTAVIFGYFAGLELSGYHWWYRPGIGAGAIPTNCGRHCVFIAMSPERLRMGPSRRDRTMVFNEVLRAVDPALGSMVCNAPTDASLCVFAGRKGFLRQACGPGWALVGDAGYFKDPLTAHGITDALRDAELLTNTTAAGTMAEYGAIRDDLSLPLFAVTDSIAALDWDIDRIKLLHQTLNKAMKREVEHLLTLEMHAQPSSRGCHDTDQNGDTKRLARDDARSTERWCDSRTLPLDQYA